VLEKFDNYIKTLRNALSILAAHV